MVVAFKHLELLCQNSVMYVYNGSISAHTKTVEQILEACKIFILWDNPLPDEEQNEHGIGNSGRQVHRLAAGLHSWTNQGAEHQLYTQ